LFSGSCDGLDSRTLSVVMLPSGIQSHVEAHP
jgi:hypothetical protein